MEKRRYTKNLIEHYPSKDDSRTTIIKGAKRTRGNGGKMFPLFTSYSEQGGVVPPFQEMSR